MPLFLDYKAADFDAAFTRLLGAKREEAVDVDDTVAQIIADVRARGDQAVLDYTEKFDRLSLEPATMRVGAEELSQARQQASKEEQAALALAAERIEAYHQRQIPQDASWVDESGMELGWRWSAVDAAGIYVPGGLASYPSSVLMNAIPARAAGVARIAMVVPAPDGLLNPLVLCAAELAGVSEIYKIGGAQAVAALAYGTQTIAPVDVITGPGNAFVAAAKRQVFGKVGIDSIAGPSEILVIADADNDPDWIAADLLSQAEHDSSAQSILITDSADLGAAVAQAVEARLARLQRREIAGASWRDYGAIITVPDLAIAASLSNRLAPEHLEICTRDPEAVSARIRHAGAIFLGAYTPEPVGDYVGGPNHVLPTARAARYASGLSVLDFMKRTTLSKASPRALQAIGPAAQTLAYAEGLEAHGLSLRVRLESLKEGEA
ncbi:MAG: histidinol dehydrogenase [Neomegalonema sp.]|nr:histidinol dehydrogenase [Neomegalonema sp.]